MANVRLALTDPAELVAVRLSSQNPRHAMAKIGVDRVRALGLTPAQINEAAASSPRGFYSWIVDYGYQGIEPLLRSSDEFRTGIGRKIAADFVNTRAADSLFTGFDAISRHNILGLSLEVYPGLRTLGAMRSHFPEQAVREGEVRDLLMANYRTPAGTPSPVSLLEDHPGWATENPDIRNIRGNMAAAVEEAYRNAQEIGQLVDAQYGDGTMSKIKNVVVFGIGANDMYLKDLPMVVNGDPASQRKLYSVFEPAQLSELPANVTADNTLYISISRGGGTQETLKSMEFAGRGKMQYLVTFSNKGLVWAHNQQFGGVAQGLENTIGGRYMWAKGKIVLVPLALCASKKGFDEYTGAMVDFDNEFWPVGNNMSVIDLASHMYLYGQAYNIPGLFACSNNPILDTGLRQFFQLHNEAVGKITNTAMAYGAGMPILPFAHAGADGILGGAISSMSYGAFIFDSSLNPRQAGLTEAELVQNFVGPDGKDYKGDLSHVGLTPELLQMACAFPNQAKLSFSGSPNFMLLTNGTGYATLATITAVYQNLMYPYLIMKGTNPDSNPNVDLVRKTTGGLVTGLLQAGDEAPMEVIARLVPGLMR